MELANFIWLLNQRQFAQNILFLLTLDHFVEFLLQSFSYFLSFDSIYLQKLFLSEIFSH